MTKDFLEKRITELSKLDGYEKPPKISGSLKLDSCLLYTSPSPRDRQKSRMPSSA